MHNTPKATVNFMNLCTMYLHNEWYFIDLQKDMKLHINVHTLEHGVHEVLCKYN